MGKSKKKEARSVTPRGTKSARQGAKYRNPCHPSDVSTVTTICLSDEESMSSSDDSDSDSDYRQPPVSKGAAKFSPTRNKAIRLPLCQSGVKPAAKKTAVAEAPRQVHAVVSKQLSSVLKPVAKRTTATPHASSCAEAVVKSPAKKTAIAIAKAASVGSARVKGTKKKMAIANVQSGSVHASNKKQKQSGLWKDHNKDANDLLTDLSLETKGPCYDNIGEYYFYEFYPDLHGYSDDDLKKPGHVFERIASSTNRMKEVVIMQIQDEPGTVQLYCLADANEVRSVHPVLHVSFLSILGPLLCWCWVRAPRQGWVTISLGERIKISSMGCSSEERFL